MDPVDTCSLSSYDSDTTVVDNTTSRENNIYDLAEFEDLYEGPKNASPNGLQEIYDPKVKPCSSFESSTESNFSEPILLSDDEYESNKINYKTEDKGVYSHKNSIELALDKDNTIFESQNFSLVDVATKEDELNVDSLNKKKIAKKKKPKTLSLDDTSPKRKKQEQADKVKVLKKVQKTIQQHSRDPEKSLEEMTINIDKSILEHEEYGEAITTQLETKGIAYIKKADSPGLISWTRKTEKIENGEIIFIEKEEKRYLKILTREQFGYLMPVITSLKESTDFEHLTVLIYGVSKPTREQELEILEVEMFFQTYWNFVTTKEDVASFIYMATKAVSYLPYKVEREEKDKLQNEYFQDVNKDLVKVDKNGNGLNRLWRQMLTKFPLAGLETAEAITAVYPTMSSIFEAYETATSSGETLVQDLPIRRAQGPLASVRKLGPEFSKKTHNYFTSLSNTLL